MIMMRAYHNRLYPFRSAVHVFHRNLALAVRPKIVNRLFLTYFGKPPGERVSQGNGHRHELSGLVAGVPKHHALVTGSADVNAHSNVR